MRERRESKQGESEDANETICTCMCEQKKLELVYETEMIANAVAPPCFRRVTPTKSIEINMRLLSKSSSTNLE